MTRTFIRRQKPEKSKLLSYTFLFLDSPAFVAGFANEFQVRIDEIILLRLQMLFKLEENNYIIICKNTL